MRPTASHFLSTLATECTDPPRAEQQMKTTLQMLLRRNKSLQRRNFLEKIMKSYSEDESDLDGDYVPGEEVEGDIEFDSDASITECSEDEDEEVIHLGILTVSTEVLTVES